MRPATTVILLTLAASLARADIVDLSPPVPHPERSRRLLVTIPGGASIEYSPGSEEDVREAARQLTSWTKSFDDKHAALVAAHPAPSPLSAQDMRDRREVILQHVATAIGREAPSELQRACYDTFLAHYELVSLFYISAGELAVEMARAPSAAVWTTSELRDRLSSGEHIPGFTYDRETDSGVYSIEAFSEAEDDETRAARAEIENKRLDHAFNYKIEDGVANISARFSFTPGETAAAPPARRRSPLSMKEPFVLPLIRDTETDERPAAEFVAESMQKFQRLLPYGIQMQRHRDPVLVWMVLHETIELGILDTYIGSPDRRWFCDGAANYLAWKIVRDLAGPEFAREVYDLDSQLERHRELQSQVDLRKWPAAENQDETERGTPLNRARYAFASRVFFMMAEKHGEDCIPALFRELGKSPRKQVTMKTVEKAFAKVTRDRLRSLVRAAEREPIPQNKET